MAPALGNELAAAGQNPKSRFPAYHGTPSVLEGWPTRLEAALAWDGTQYQSEGKYTFLVTEQEKAEVEAALKAFKDLELDGHQVNRSNFPLPLFESRLNELARDLHKGKGFLVLRGLKIDEHSLEDNIIIFLGVSSYLGERRGKQDINGSMLMHIYNATKMKAFQEDRPARDSNLGLAFHSDLWTDIVALQTLGCAAQGGNHVISPGYTIYNELAATRPDLLESLAKPDWVFDEHSLHHTPDRRPLIAYHSGRVFFNFGRLHVFGEDSKVVRSNLSAKQLESFEYLQEIAQKHQLSLPLQPGDLCFINNFAVLHSRQAFQDTPEQTRHLVRLWLKNEYLAWKLPPHLVLGNQKVFYDDSMEEHWEIIPAPRLEFKIRDKFSP